MVNTTVTHFFDTHIRILLLGEGKGKYYVDYLPNHNEFYAFNNFPYGYNTGEKDHYRMPAWLVMA